MGDLLGPNFLQFLLLALAGALVVGNALALVRPPGSRGQHRDSGPGSREGPAIKPAVGSDEAAGSGDLERAPLWRTVGMLAVGLIVVVWILVSLAS